MEPTTPKKSIGPIIGIVVIVVVLVIGAFYVWGGKSDVGMKPTTNPNDMAAPTVAPVSKSDEVGAIDADLQTDSSSNVDLSGLDAIK